MKKYYTAHEALALFGNRMWTLILAQKSITVYYTPTQSEFLVLQPEERPEAITDEDSDLDETGNPSFKKRLSNPDQ